MKPLKNLIFQITKQKELDFSFLTEKQMLLFPVHEHHLREVQQSLIVYEYNAGSKFKEEEWIKILIKELKEKYNAYSVIFLGSKLPEPTLNK